MGGSLVDRANWVTGLSLKAITVALELMSERTSGAEILESFAQLAFEFQLAKHRIFVYKNVLSLLATQRTAIYCFKDNQDDQKCRRQLRTPWVAQNTKDLITGRCLMSHQYRSLLRPGSPSRS